MGLIPDPRTLLSFGTSRVLSGLRRGDQQALLTGAALAAFGWWRKSSGPKKTLLHRQVVKKGTSLVVRSGGDQRGVDVRRVEDPPT